MKKMRNLSALIALSFLVAQPMARAEFTEMAKSQKIMNKPWVNFEDIPRSEAVEVTDVEEVKVYTISETDLKSKIKEKQYKVTSTQTGMASMYWQPQKTGCRPYGMFNPSAMTAAHKTLPCGTKVRVINPANGKSVIVTINDRGPYVAGRIIDLSKASFTKIASASKGVTKVKLEVIKEIK